MKKKKISNELKIGIFGIAMLALLYWGVNFLKGTELFSSSEKYYAVYDQVNGLKPSSAISVKGFKVGTISKMMYDPRRSDKIVLELSVKSKFKIPVNSTAKIYSDGILGGKALEIELGDAKTFLSSGDTIYTATGKDFLEVAGGEIEFLKQKVNVIASDLSATLKSLNALLEENRTNIQTTLSNTAAITGNINTVLSSEKGSLKTIIANINTLTKSLNDRSGQIGNIVDNFESLSDSLNNGNIPALVTELNTTFSELNKTLEAINSGQGTAGKLINDDTLHQEIVGTMGDLQLLIDDIKANPGRYVNISVFGKKNK